MNDMTTPKGYRANAQGHLVPENVIKPIDLLRDDTVRTLIASANTLQEQMREFKTKALSDIAAFLEISANQYGIKMGGKKGNINLVSYDGQYKVLIAVSDTQVFDERLQVAKTLVDECIHDWAKDSNDKIRALVEHAFQTDKQGNLNTARIFGLMRLKIDDEKWQRAMEALKDSIQVSSTSEYLRLYQKVKNEKNGQESYKQVVLDIAGL